MRVFLYLVISIGIVFLVGLEFLWLSPNYNIGAVESGSMAPALNPGDLVITTKAQGEIKPGTIITYNQENEVIIHRAVLIENGQLRTKGDANKKSGQRLIPVAEVKWTYLFKIPFLGRFVAFIETHFYQIFIGICFVALVVIYKNKKGKLKKGGEE